jgi:uncharacterized membrane protein YkvA (DUF1232 family)
MANASEWARRFEEWTTSLANDVQATWEMLTNESVAPQGRRWLAGALSYTLTQLDLIPDHERAGSIDDAFVLRVAYGLAAEHAGKTSTDDSARIARMTHDEDQLRDFLGDGLYAKLRRHVMELVDKEVRGRTVDHILADARVRQDMKRELDIQCKKMKPSHVGSAAEAEALTVSVTSYLKMKLGAPNS